MSRVPGIEVEIVTGGNRDMDVGNSSIPSQPPSDLSTRIGLLFALFISSAVCSLIPVVCAWCGSKRKALAAKEAGEEKPWKQILLGILNCFSGGVFLGVTFLHLLPDITKDWEKIFSEVMTTSYPFDRFLVVIGFFIVLVIEQMAYACQSSKPRKKRKKVVPAAETRTISIQPNIVASLIMDTDAAPLLSDEEEDPVDCEQCRQEHVRHTQPEVTSKSKGEPTENSSLLHDSAHYTPDTVKVDGYQAIGGAGDEGKGEGAEKNNEATAPGGLRAVFLGMALSVHSVFEGLAFGLIQSPSDVCRL